MAEHATSVHLDLEPDPAAETSVASVLEAYREVLDSLADSLQCSVFLAPFWFTVDPDAAIGIRDHEAVDWSVIAAYATTEADCRRELEHALQGDPQTPYVAAFEFQSPGLEVVTDGITFWDAGSSKAMNVMEAIATRPETPAQFRGIALHEYESVTSDHYR